MFKPHRRPLAMSAIGADDFEDGSIDDHAGRKRRRLPGGSR